MHAPRALAAFNRRVTNPIQRRWAGVIPLHGIIEHTGRRSGRPYRTPVLAFVQGDRVSFLVGYGLQSDWVRNLLAAHQGGLEHRRRHYAMSDVTLVPSPEGRVLLPAPLRLLTRVFGIGDVVTARLTLNG